MAVWSKSLTFKLYQQLSLHDEKAAAARRRRHRQEPRASGAQTGSLSAAHRRVERAMPQRLARHPLTYRHPRPSRTAGGGTGLAHARQRFAFWRHSAQPSEQHSSPHSLDGLCPWVENVRASRCPDAKSVSMSNLQGSSKLAGLFFCHRPWRRGARQRPFPLGAGMGLAA